MENKKIITSCGCLPSQKPTFSIEPNQSFTGSYEKCVEVLHRLQDTQNIKR